MSGAPDPNDFTHRYNTPLNPDQEAQYQGWGALQALQTGRNPAADTYDYDMRGFWQSGGGFAANGHAGDQFKKPNHPSFSDQSQYHGADGFQGGQWGGGQAGQPWTFVPSQTNLNFHGPAGLQRYFGQQEPGNQLLLQAPPPVPTLLQAQPSPLAAVQSPSLAAVLSGAR